MLQEQLGSLCPDCQNSAVVQRAGPNEGRWHAGEVRRPDKGATSMMEIQVWREGALGRLLASLHFVLIFSPASGWAQLPSDPLNHSRSSRFEYINGFLSSEFVEPGIPNLCTQTSYQRDNWGNQTVTKVSNCTGAAGDAVFTERQVTQAWSRATMPKFLVGSRELTLQVGQFPLDVTNAAGQKTQQLFDPRFGQPIEVRVPAGPSGDLISRVEYDELGRKVLELRPDGTRRVVRYCILLKANLDPSSNSAGCSDPEHAPADAVQFVQSWEENTQGVKMGPWALEYTDRLGRVIRTAREGFAGDEQPGSLRGGTIVRDFVFNVAGTKVLETQPYWSTTGSSTNSGSNDVGVTSVLVDALGRPVDIYTADTNAAASSARSFGSAAYMGYGAYGSRRASRVHFDYEGSKTSTSNDRGYVRVEEKNPVGEVVRVTDPLGAQLVHQYDAFGGLIYTKDPLSNVIRVSADIRGRKVKQSDPDAGEITYGYNALGEVVWQQNPNQRSQSVPTFTRYKYDRLRRKVSQTDNEFVSTWSYDRYADGSACFVGRLCESSTSHGVRKRYWFDDMGRPLSERLDVDGGVSMAQSRTWAADTGRLITQTWPTGVKLRQDYTSLGELKQITLPQASTILPLPANPGGSEPAEVSWPATKMLWRLQTVNAWGRPETFASGGATDAGVLSTRISYDPFSGRQLSRLAGTGAATGVLNQEYSWDDLGRLDVRIDRNGNATNGDDVSETFQYDSLHRLIQYQVQGPDVPALQRTVNLSYNALGMLLKRSDVGAYTYAPVVGGAVTDKPHALRSQTALNGRVTKYGYDANGNLATADAGKYRKITYNSFNQPGSELGIRNADDSLIRRWQYDETHARLQETVERISGSQAGTQTTWRWHPNNEGGLSFEHEVNSPTIPSASNPAVAQSRHFVAAAGQVVAVLVTEAALPKLGTGDKAPPVKATITYRKVESWHVDHLGSLITTTDHAGVVRARYAYDPFGQRRESGGAADPNQALEVDWSLTTNAGTANGFTGHQHLDDVGLVHMNGRLYDPRLGVFLQADPVIQAPLDLQNYHRYAYCMSSPMGCTDPSGFCFMGCFWQPKRWGVAGRVLFAVFAHSVLGPMAGAWLSSNLAGAGLISAADVLTVMKVADVATSGFMLGAAESGSLSGGLKGMFKAVAFQGAGDALEFMSAADDILASAAVHGVVGCVTGVADGSKCGPSALSAAFSEAATVGGLGGTKDPVFGLVRSVAIGGTASVLGGGNFRNGASTAAYAYLFNCVRHGCQRKVDDLSQKLSNEQSAATLKFFNPADVNPLTPEGITGIAKNLSADYIVSATEIQSVADGVKGFAGQVAPATSLMAAFRKAFESFLGIGKTELWQWSSELGDFSKQLASRFGAAARNGVSNAFRTRYEELKGDGQ